MSNSVMNYSCSGSAIFVLWFSCSPVFSVCRPVTQKANTVVPPEVPGGHLPLASICWYVNQAFLQRVFGL